MSPIKKENATLIFIGTNLIITAALRLHYQKKGKPEGSHNTKDATQEQSRMKLELKSILRHPQKQCKTAIHTATAGHSFRMYQKIPKIIHKSLLKVVRLISKL